MSFKLTAVFSICCCFFTAISGKSIVVGTIGELLDANSDAQSGDSILIEDGTYQIESYGIMVRTNNLTFTSLSGDREKVIITGAGMNGGIQYGFWIPGSNVTISNLTIQGVRNHCIQTDVNNDGLHVDNCILKDAFEQLLKVPTSSSNPDPSENGIVENCLFEFSAGVAEQYYTGGVDCHLAKNWVVRNNCFKNIRSPAGQSAEFAIHFWSNSEGTVVENNTIINCDRGIGFGLGDRGHRGGIIRNNMIYHSEFSSTDYADVGIAVENCPDAKILNNTIFYENSYPNAIEYRFALTENIQIINNLTNKSIRLRDNASEAEMANNITNAQKDWFVFTQEGDLHIKSNATDVIDRGASVADVTTDLDGETRNIDKIDIGADELLITGSHYSKENFIQKKSNHSPYFKAALLHQNYPSSVTCNKRRILLSGKSVAASTITASSVQILFNDIETMP